MVHRMNPETVREWAIVVFYVVLALNLLAFGVAALLTLRSRRTAHAEITVMRGPFKSATISGYSAKDALKIKESIEDTWARLEQRDG